MSLALNDSLASPQYADSVLRLVVNETVDIAASANKTYNVAALLTTDVSKYDLLTVAVEVQVLDTETGSPTKDYYVSAAAIAQFGVKPDGTVLIRNTHTAQQKFMVRVTVRRKAYVPPAAP